MFFGKYLIENGVVTPEQLVDAIIIQMESLPSIIRMAKKRNVLDCQKIIDLVEKSIGEKRNMAELMVEKSIMGVETVNSLLNERRQEGRGLCEILVREGYVSSMIVSEYAKKYLNYQNDTKKMVIANEKEEGVINFNARGEFVKIFDEELFRTIEREVESVKNKERGQHVFNIKKDLTLLITVAEMGELEYVIRVLQVWLKVLDCSAGVESKGHWSEVASGLKYMLGLIWNFREEYVRKGSASDGLKEKYHDGIRRAEYLLEDCRHE